MIEIGRMNKHVELQRVMRVASGDGYSEVWTTYATAYAAIEPATPRVLEMLTSATITTPVSHLVTLPYVAGVQGADRVSYQGRALYIAGMQNPDETDRVWIFGCEERRP